jgi:hypothetical protein
MSSWKQTIPLPLLFPFLKEVLVGEKSVGGYPYSSAAAILLSCWRRVEKFPEEIQTYWKSYELYGLLLLYGRLGLESCCRRRLSNFVAFALP